MKLTVMAFSAALAAVSFGDQIFLKSGSVLSGTVTAVACGELTFKSDDLGEVKVKLDKIVKLENAGEHVIQRHDLSETKLALAVADGKYMAGGKELEMATVKAIDPVPEKWHGNVNLAFNGSRGNTFENSAAVVANLKRRWEQDRLNLDFGYYYGEEGKAGGERQKNTDRWEIEGKHDHFWQPKVYSYEDLKWERDLIQGLDSRYRVGVGAGYQWLEGAEFESTGKWSFNQEVGANWVREEYEVGDDDSDGFGALRYGHHLTFLPKLAPSVECFHNLEVLPDVEDWEKFLANADLGCSTKIIYDFDLLCKVEFEFNSEPAADRKKSDVRYLVGLGYKW